MRKQDISIKNFFQTKTNNVNSNVQTYSTIRNKESIRNSCPNNTVVILGAHQIENF